MFVTVLHLDTARGDEMEVDGDVSNGAQHRWEEDGSSSKAGSVAVGLPTPPAKRKRAACRSSAHT
jgi:hypothetical protein